MALENYEVMAIQVQFAPDAPDTTDYLWCVIEITSGQLIWAFAFEDDANELADHLNEGGGFDGWTPPFILNDVSEYIDINDEFESAAAA
jgi:hypothetical protein